MAKLFEISVPDGMSAIKLDSQGRGSVQYTVKNVSARPIDGRAVLVPVPADPPDPNHPVQKGWVKIDGKPERHFDVNGEDTFTVNVAVLPKNVQPGTYGYRMDVVSVATPDVGDKSTVLKFEVKAGEKPKPKWGILIAVIAVVLVAGAIGIWFALRSKNTEMPDLRGMNIADATAKLTAINVRIDQPIATELGKPEDAGNVTKQSVPPGTPIAKDAKDTSIKLTVGATFVQPPNLIGQKLKEADRALVGVNLAMGKVTNEPNSNFGPGVVWWQSADVHSNVPSNSSVDVKVTPDKTTVPQLAGLNGSQVLEALTKSSLTGTFMCNLTNLPAVGPSLPV